MKRIRRIIILLALVFILLVAAGIGIYFYSDNRQEPVDASDKAAMDEYLIESSLEKAPDRVVGVYLDERRDGCFTEEDETFAARLSTLEEAFFERVYLQPYPELDSKVPELHSERLLYAASKLKEMNKQVYCMLFAEQSYDLSDAEQLLEGILLVGEDSTVQRLNERAAELKKSFPHIKIGVLCSLELEGIEELDDSIDFIELTAFKKGDGEKISRLSLKRNIVCALSCEADSGLTDVSVPLENLYALKSTSQVKGVSFSDMTAISENKGNCFGAVKEYITDGISAEFAFREPGVRDYDGSLITISDYTAHIKIFGSYLYPFMVNGVELQSSASGNIAAAVDLAPGENGIIISQCGSTTEYRVQSSGESDLVTYISPSDTLELTPSEEYRIIVIAHRSAEISVKLGTERFKAVCDEQARGYTAFIATIKAPDSEQEIASLGAMSIIAVYGEKSTQYQGARVYPSGSEPPEPQNQEQTTAAPTVEIGNNSPTLSYDPYGNTVAEDNLLSGGYMCVVKEPYADTKLTELSDKFSPSCSPLPEGTMDYVTGESTGTNDDGEAEYYYELASGMKIKKDKVNLVSITDMGDNHLQVISSVERSGKLQITLKTDWRVPFTVNYTSPGYNYADSKYFSVDSFDATEVSYTFYHTPTASGTVETFSQGVVSGAQWSSSSSAGTSTLSFSLSAAGGYYGSSLEYDGSGNMVITFNRRPVGASGSIVVLDPGHGGAEPGAVGLDSAVQERYLNLSIAYYVKSELEKAGVTVYMTRSGNDREKDTLSLEQRKVFTRGIKPDLFVSIHCNGSYNEQSIGTSAFYYEPFSYTLANNIYEQLLSVHKNYLYADRPKLHPELEDGTRYYPFSVTRIEDCPSILVEVGYLTNDAECAKLVEIDNQERFGKAIATGIINTLNGKKAP